MHRICLACVTFLALLSFAGCQPVPTDPPRAVSVSGEAELTVAPDIALVHLAVEARDRELALAQAQAGEVVDAVLELTDALEIARERVQSTQLRVQPEFDWHEGRQSFRGYLVQREVRVELHDLAKLGPLLERAMTTGVNHVSAPELKLKDPRRLHREALALAAADAKANAAALARTLDASLGDVRQVRALGASAPPVPMTEMRMRAADIAASEQTYEAGRITVRAVVQAEFELN